MDIVAKSKIPKSPIIKSSIPKSFKSPDNSNIPKSNLANNKSNTNTENTRSRSKSSNRSHSTMSDRKSGDRYSNQEYRPSYGFVPQINKSEDRRRSLSKNREAHEVKSNFSQVFRTETKTLPDFEEDFGPIGKTVVRELEHGAPSQDVSGLFQRPNTTPALHLSNIPPPTWERRNSEKDRRESVDQRRSSRSKSGSYGFTTQDLDDILAKYKGNPNLKSEQKYQDYQTPTIVNYENVDPDFRGFSCCDKKRNNQDLDYHNHNNGTDLKYQNSKKKSEDVTSLLNTAFGHQDHNIHNQRFPSKDHHHDAQKTYRKTHTHAFPFKETPNGELIVYPEQVAFESKTLSVLVADPGKIGIKIKAEKGHNQEQVFKKVEEAVQKSLAHLYDIHGRHLSDFDNDHRQRRKTEDDYIDKEIVFMQYSNATQGTEKLMAELHQRLRSAKHADTHVVIGDKVYPCHSLALEVYSNYFDNLNRSNDSIRRVELPESQVPAFTFPIVMDWIMQSDQGRQPIINMDNVVSLFSTATFLEIQELKTQCINLLNEKLETNDSNLMQLWDEVKKRPNCQELMSVISSKAAVSFQHIYKERQFLDLDIDEIVMLLSSDDIVIDSELDVYDAATRWLLKDWKGRQVYTNPVMSTVRFALLSPLQLTQIAHSPDLNQDSSLKEYTEILNNGYVKTMLDQGLAFSILEESYKNQPEEFDKWMESTGIKAPRPRNHTNPTSRTQKFSYLNYKDDISPSPRANDLHLDRRPSYTVLRDGKPDPKKRPSRSVVEMFHDRNQQLESQSRPKSQPQSNPGYNVDHDHGRHLEEAADMAGQPIPEQDIENLTRSRSRPRSKDRLHNR